MESCKVGARAMKDSSLSILTTFKGTRDPRQGKQVNWAGLTYGSIAGAFARGEVASNSPERAVRGIRRRVWGKMWVRI